MKVLYTRISTSINQKVDRQIVDKDQYDYVLMDTCSGSIPLYERPKGSEIEKLISWGKLKELHVHSIDRLGRNTIDVLSTWKDLTEKDIRIICKILPSKILMKMVRWTSSHLYLLVSSQFYHSMRNPP